MNATTRTQPRAKRASCRTSNLAAQVTDLRRIVSGLTVEIEDLEQMVFELVGETRALRARALRPEEAARPGTDLQLTS